MAVAIQHNCRLDVPRHMRVTAIAKALRTLASKLENDHHDAAARAFALKIERAPLSVQSQLVCQWIER